METDGIPLDDRGIHVADFMTSLRGKIGDAGAMNIKSLRYLFTVGGGPEETHIFTEERGRPFTRHPIVSITASSVRQLLETMR